MFAPGTSILLSATMMFTFAALAWLMASSVCGMMPSSAAITMTAMSVTCAARPHGSERRVAGRIEEGDLLAVVLDGVRADVLGDATGLASRRASCGWRP